MTGTNFFSKISKCYIAIKFSVSTNFCSIETFETCPWLEKYINIDSKFSNLGHFESKFLDNNVNLSFSDPVVPCFWRKTFKSCKIIFINLTKNFNLYQYSLCLDDLFWENFTIFSCFECLVSISYLLPLQCFILCLSSVRCFIICMDFLTIYVAKVKLCLELILSSFVAFVFIYVFIFFLFC